MIDLDELERLARAAILGNDETCVWPVECDCPECRYRRVLENPQAVLALIERVRRAESENRRLGALVETLDKLRAVEGSLRSGGNGECPLCHGTGQRPAMAFVSRDGISHPVGSEPGPHEPCPLCSGAGNLDDHPTDGCHAERGCPEGEHLHVCCGGCGYKWVALCADAERSDQ